MGRDAASNRVSVLEKVQECLAAANEAVAGNTAVTDTLNAMAIETGSHIDRLQAQINQNTEGLDQQRKRAEMRDRLLEQKIIEARDANRDEILKGLTAARQDLSVDIRLAVDTAIQEEVRLRTQGDFANRVAMRAFEHMTRLERLKWLLFGAVLRPAAAPESEKPEAIAVIDRDAFLAAQ